MPLWASSQDSSNDLEAVLRFHEILAEQRQPMARISGEMVADQKLSLSGSVNLVFITTWDDVSGKIDYLTIKPEALHLIATDPVVTAPPDLEVELVDASVTPSVVSAGSALMDGTRIRCEIEVQSNAPIRGEREITVTFPSTQTVATAIGAVMPQRPPMVIFDLTLYPSEEERRLHAEERERARQDAAEAAKRSRREKGRAELLNGLKWLGIGVAGLFAVVTAVTAVDRLKTWSFPKHRVTVRSATSDTARGEVKVTRQISEGEMHRVPGLFHEEKKAATFFGSKADVTVELDGVPTRREVNLVTSTYTNDSVSTTSSWYEEVLYYQVAIRARRGAGTKPGHFLAETSAGTVKIRVLA